MSFSEVIGHEAVIQRLRAAIRNDRVAHGYIFAGPDGVGKALVAEMFAKAILCETASDDACGQCISCRKFDHDNHPGFERLKLDGKGQVITVDAIADLQRSLAYGAYGEKHRVILLDSAHRMLPAGANKLLKTLEEPPPGVIFILVTAQPTALLDTIVSRCQMARFGPVAREKVETLLVESKGAEAEKARLAAAMSEGSPGKAIGLLESDLVARRDDLLEKLLTLDTVNSPELVERFVKEINKGAESTSDKRAAARGLLALMLYVYRDILAVCVAAEEYPLYSADRPDALLRAAQGCDTGDVIAIVDMLIQAILEIDANVNLEMLLDDLLAQMARLSPWQRASA